MKVTINLDRYEALFLKHLADEDHGSVEDYFNWLFHEQMMVHPHYRTCSNIECLIDVMPRFITFAKKTVYNPECCYGVDTAPCDTCPECGAPTVSYLEGMEIGQAAFSVIRRTEALTAIAAQKRADYADLFGRVAS